MGVRGASPPINKMAIKYMNEFILFLLLGILLYYYLGKKIKESMCISRPDQTESSFASQCPSQAPQL